MALKSVYSEDDEMAPLNVYADSKSKAELALRRYVPDRHLILRTSWVYGPDRQRRNFILRMVDQMGQQQTWPVPADQWGSPTYTDDLAKATRMLIKHGHTGTFHATGPEFVSRVALAHRVCVKFGLDSSRLGSPSNRNSWPGSAKTTNGSAELSEITRSRR